MRAVRFLARFLRDLVSRDRFERDLETELDAYVDAATEAHVRDGIPEAEARRLARLELGGVEQTKESVRDYRSSTFLESTWQDCRYASRRLRQQPGFTLVAVATLAIGIGANTAIFSVVRSVMLAPLPFGNADRLVRLRIVAPDATGAERQLSLVPAYFHEVRSRSHLIEEAAAQRFQNVTLTGDGDPERIIATGVSDRWAETLGIEAALGRTFTADEQREGDAARVAVVGHALWMRRFAGDPGVIGRTVRLNDAVYTVVGVMPPEYRYPYNTELWFPVSIDRQAMVPGDLNAPARMRPGVTAAELNAELSALSEALADEYAGGDDLRLTAVPMDVEFERDPNRSVAALAVAVGLVLLLACVNLATLLLARLGSRMREVTLRTALGASRARLVRQWLTESVLLAAVGGIGGILLALAASRWLAGLIPPRLGEVVERVHVDTVVLAWSVILCGVTGVLFGILPALQATGNRGMHALRDGGRPGSARRGWAEHALVVGEAALAVVLLAGAALMAQNFARLTSAGVGYEPDGLTRVTLALSAPAYEDPARRAAVVGEIVERVSHLPGVEHAGVTNIQAIPRTRANFGTSLEPDTLHDPQATLPVVNRRLVTPGYFEALGVTLVAGRAFEAGDTVDAAPVVVVSRAAADRFWPGENPIGRRLRPAQRENREIPWHTVVGVVADVMEPNPAEMPETIYQPYAQAAGTLPPGVWVTTSATLLVRSRGEESSVVTGVRAAVAEVDPAMPLFDIAPMARVLAEPLADQQLGTTLFVAFGAFGLLMAVLGTYGVLALSVGRRTAEFGVRLALGEAPAALLRSVLGQGIRLVAAGLGLGLAGALLLSRLMGTVLTEIGPRDPVTLALVTGLLFAAGVAASFVPAWRATRVDPVIALRAE